MKITGKILKIYVRGTTPKALQSIEIVNWSGKAYMGNRGHLRQLKEIPELAETGIYFLLNENEESGLTEIYIGETDSASNRLNQHTSKDWWTKFVVFISRDLTKAHVKYLENKLYKLAMESVSTLKVMNSDVPSSSKLPEPDACAMEEFAANMIFTVETLGLGLFQPENSKTFFKEEIESDTTPVRSSIPKNYDLAQGMEFSITLPKELSGTGQYLKAHMVVDEGSFFLKAGSPIRSEAAGESFKGHSYYEIWKQIISSNAVKKTENPEILITTRDLEFKSPSAVGAIVRARATNGRTEWKRTSDNKSFVDCETEEAA